MLFQRKIFHLSSLGMIQSSQYIDQSFPPRHDRLMFSSLFTRRQPTTERFTLNYAGRILNVTLSRRSNAKRLTMRVRDGALTLTTPPEISQNDASAFIRKHFEWVLEQLIAEERTLRHLDESTDGAPSIWYRGNVTPVHLVRDENHHGKTRIRYQDNVITITMPSFDPTSRLRPHALLEDWLKKQARADIKAALGEVLPLIDEPPVPLSIRDQKTRWGSCSTTRRLSFNWRLIMAPPASLHYVVVHEAAHLIHHDHSDRFWGLVEDMMPDFATHQKWLKTHQQALFTGLDRRLSGLKPQRA